MQRHRSPLSGFTLVELLVALVVFMIIIIGIIGMIGFGLLSRSLAQSRDDEAVYSLAQAIPSARNKALRTGSTIRIDLRANGYDVTREDTETRIAQLDTSRVTFSPANVSLRCSPKGFCLATQGSSPITLSGINAETMAGKTRHISLTPLGLTEVK